MEQGLFEKTLGDGLDSLGIVLEDRAVHALYLYFTELKKWSRKVNLIAKGTGDREIIENHFVDSLTLLPLLSERDHLLDIGTGAGFPGLVLKAALPGMMVTLVEPRRKRVSFLGHIIRRLQLDTINVVECRVEDERKLPSSLGATLITSRAVTEIDDFLKMCARFAQPGVKVVCMKGPRWKEELAGAERGEASSFRYCDQRQFRLPDSGAERALVVFES